MLEERIAVLEQQVKDKDELLHVEKGLNSRLRSKVKKLFKSLKKRNKALSQTRINLAVVQQTLKSREEEELLLPLSVNLSSASERHRASAERKQRRKEAQAQKLLEDEDVERCGEEEGITLEERAELIGQLQDQIAETRDRYVKNSVEVAELKEKRKRGEEDLDVLEGTASSEAQKEALAREFQDKEKLGLRLVKRIFNLQMQVAEHQGYLADEAEEEELKGNSSGGSTGSPAASDREDEGEQAGEKNEQEKDKQTQKEEEATGEEAAGEGKELKTKAEKREMVEGADVPQGDDKEPKMAEEQQDAEQDVPEGKQQQEDTGETQEEAENQQKTAKDSATGGLVLDHLAHGSDSDTSSPKNSSDLDSDEEEAERDRALIAFLVAAGAAAEPILQRKALLGAFKAAPPCLKGDLLSRCSDGEKAQVISLFGAWCAISTQTDCLLLDSVSLGTDDLESLKGTLESCGPKISEWDMSMCRQAWHPARRETLLDCLASQPLKQLFVSHNYIGSRGIKPLTSRFPCWASKMYHLGLEMNAMQDIGFATLEDSLLSGALPHLKVLDLRWNNLTDKSKDGLVRLLQKQTKIEEAPSSELENSDEAGVCVVPKLKLGEKQADKRVTARALPKLQALLLGGNKLSSEGASEVALAALQLPGDKLDLDLSANRIDHDFVKPLTQWVCRIAPGTTVNVALNLEQNFFDDNEPLLELTEALGRQRLRSEQPGRPLLRAPKNELQDIDRSDILTRSGGLVRL